MADDVTASVQSQFGRAAADYATSSVHAQGESLARIVELTAPKKTWEALDVATGAGHTAAIFAPHVASMIASDITDEMLHQVCRRTDNMHFFGAYDSARELDQIYGAIDIAWAVDFSAQGANSDWLIPNRIYESGLYGVPVIARKDTTTGQRVEELGMGWSFAEPFGANVETFLSELDVKDYDRTVSTLMAGGSDPVITKKPEGAWTPAIYDAMKK